MADGIQEIKEKALPILRDAGVTRSAIFGSAARGDAVPGSDIDLLVELPDGRGLLDLIELQMKLEGAFKRKVDVVTYRSISPFLKERIEREQLPIL